MLKTCLSRYCTSYSTRLIAWLYACSDAGTTQPCRSKICNDQADSEKHIQAERSALLSYPATAQAAWIARGRHAVMCADQQSGRQPVHEGKAAAPCIQAHLLAVGCLQDPPHRLLLAHRLAEGCLQDPPHRLSCCTQTCCRTKTCCWLPTGSSTQTCCCAQTCCWMPTGSSTQTCCCTPACCWLPTGSSAQTCCCTPACCWLPTGSSSTQTCASSSPASTHTHKHTHRAHAWGAGISAQARAAGALMAHVSPHSLCLHAQHACERCDIICQGFKTHAPTAGNKWGKVHSCGLHALLRDCLHTRHTDPVCIYASHKHIHRCYMHMFCTITHGCYTICVAHTYTHRAGLSDQRLMRGHSPQRCFYSPASACARRWMLVPPGLVWSSARCHLRLGGCGLVLLPLLLLQAQCCRGRLACTEGRGTRRSGGRGCLRWG